MGDAADVHVCTCKSGEEESEFGDHDLATPFVLVGANELPPALAAAALASLTAFGLRNGITLDVSPFVPTHGARRAWDGYSFGEPVIGLVTWRGVGEVRIGGVPGLLVAQVTAVDDETAGDALARAGTDVYFVSFATAADADRVVLTPEPGFPLPNAPGARDGER
jgi:hypothetical protein